ncbi:UDP-glucuronosyltransferase [Aphelenchoides besseyi]|nr:UDP-glucuronosyltransferase [Aphelenchoides besseyi]KAI6236107.1 UDP-glucuronosyltransferase [Aphelenchoides besseyi]
MKVVSLHLLFVIQLLCYGLVNGLRILQIVPGFTNSHVLFNYRLADTLTAEGHSVKMWTQMEMGMVVAGDLRMPQNVSEVRVPIYFSDTMKSEGLKVFQTMMFQAGSAYDLYWTGQEFKDLRVQSCEQMLSVDSSVINEFRQDYFHLVIGHFHDFCPIALTKLVGVKELVWITHGTSVYDYTAIQIGMRTFPSFVPHPLSSFSDRMSLYERILNVFWHLSNIDFVNLPQNLLHDENSMYRRCEFNTIAVHFLFPVHKASGDEDLWSLSRRVRVLLVNGERFLDFPKPIPFGVNFIGEVKTATKNSPLNFTGEVAEIVNRATNLVIFSLGTVSNTTNMPSNMLNSFLEAFAQFPEYDFLWRMEAEVPNAHKYTNVHLLKWLPQKDLMKHPKTRLLIAHGGYNSFLEASQAGIPVVLMPLFADQFINAKRAQRFGIATTLDKLSLSVEKVRAAVAEILFNEKYSQNAKRLSAMLRSKPSTDPSAMLKYGLKLATLPRDHFTLRAAQNLNFVAFYNLDAISFIFLLPTLLFTFS